MAAESAKLRASEVVVVVCAAVMCAVSFLMGGCDVPIETAAGGTVPMKCHWAFIATGIASLLAVVSGVSSALVKGAGARRACGICSLATAVVCALLLSPAGIGLCAHEQSACHLPAYAVWALALALAVASAVQCAQAGSEGVAKPKMKL